MSKTIVDFSRLTYNYILQVYVDVITYRAVMLMYSREAGRYSYDRVRACKHAEPVL